MKHRVCISVEEDVLVNLRESLRSGKFRNKSHAFEYSLRRLLEDE